MKIIIAIFPIFLLQFLIRISSFVTIASIIPSVQKYEPPMIELEMEIPNENDKLLVMSIPSVCNSFTLLEQRIDEISKNSDVQNLFGNEFFSNDTLVHVQNRNALKQHLISLSGKHKMTYDVLSPKNNKTIFSKGISIQVQCKCFDRNNWKIIFLLVHMETQEKSRFIFNAEDIIRPRYREMYVNSIPLKKLK